MTAPALTRFLACPLCSNVGAVEAPFWRLARNVSAVRGKRCFSLGGCKHAREIGGDRIIEATEEMEMMQDTWTRFALAAFESRTERWSQPERDRFKRHIDGNPFFIPGAVEPLPFGDDQPNSGTENK